MKIGIIGGTKGLGKTLASYLKCENFNVTITGRDKKSGIETSKKLNVDFTTDNDYVAKNSDILIIAVPIANTVEVIKNLAGKMKKGSVMIDVTSIKMKPTETMEECLNSEVEFIPTHPIFGPRTPSLEGQVIVLTPTVKGKWYPKIYNFLKNKNMRIIETTPEHHDYMMGIVQVLTHFSYISIASTIEKLNINLKDTENYESPIYNLMIDIIARITSQNPYLTYSIQTENKNGNHIRQSFIDATCEIKDVLLREDEEKFREITINAKKHMGDVKAALGRSDKAIAALTNEEKQLHSSIGREIGLQHIYSQSVHVGIVKELKDGFVILKSTRNNSNREYKLKISNIIILTEEELFEWKKKNWKIYTYSISCLFEECSDSTIIKDTLLKVPNISSVKLTDTYNGPQIDKGKVSYTFEIESLSEESAEDIKELILGFGAKIR
ncbi:prephenate dehydrogenase [uncultured Methanobrevibacter sp.]|uniref:prephenate dehydrogenase n=1 Tax=uncultured Methanobrevibacter sp. TaxID=253161 RepID=UPI0025F9850B|nr:prephenate dehydrogenase [uncultured Methanobrevibacter sp.]